jgi:pimeloyl-ACP methyl ester carboxylesterase
MKNVVFQAIGERLVEGSAADQVGHFEVASVELADGQRYPTQTAARNDGRDAAPIGKARVEHGLRFRDVIAEAARDVIRTPLLLIHGSQDNLPPQSSEIMFQGLAQLGKNAQFALYQGEPHDIGWWSRQNAIDATQRVPGIRHPICAASQVDGGCSLRRLPQMNAPRKR